MCKYIINNEQENPLDINELRKYFVKLYHGILTEAEERSNILVPIDIHLDDEPSVLFNIYTHSSQIFYLYKGKYKGIERISQEELNEIRKNRVKYDASNAR